MLSSGHVELFISSNSLYSTEKVLMPSLNSVSQSQEVAQETAAAGSALVQNNKEEAMTIWPKNRTKDTHNESEL